MYNDIDVSKIIHHVHTAVVPNIFRAIPSMDVPPPAHSPYGGPATSPYPLWRSRHQPIPPVVSGYR